MTISKSFPDVVGLTVIQARETGLNIRVLKEDGASKMVSADHRPTRLCVEVENGKITKCVRWG